MIEREIEIVMQTSRMGRETPHLICSLDCLAQFFMTEDAYIAEEDVNWLMSLLCKRAADSRFGDTTLAESNDGYYTGQATDTED